MKTIEVVAAIIHHDGKILATQRGYGDFKDGWEFPGGKMEAGETAEHAIVREIEEELNVEIRPEKLLHTVEYDYPNFHLTMHCFISVIMKGTIVLIEHEDAKWLKPDELDSVAWLPADVEVVEKLKVYLKENRLCVRPLAKSHSLLDRQGKLESLVSLCKGLLFNEFVEVFLSGD